MHEHLYKYLVLYGHLSIPHVGNFALVQQPAAIDQESNELLPPMPVIRFSEGDTPPSDKVFFDFLTEDMGVDEVSAIKAFHEFSGNLRTAIQEKNSAVFEGVGVFNRTEQGLEFMAENQLSELLPAMEIAQLVMPAPEIPATQDKNWWYYAIILLILGAGALVYYYI